MADNPQEKKAPIEPSKPEIGSFVTYSSIVDPQSFIDSINLGPISLDKQPHSGTLPDVLAQRHHQRRVIFYGAWFLSLIFSALLVWMVYFQAQCFLGLGKTPFSDKVFAVLVLGIFGQIISVIVVISRAVWDDKNYARYLDRTDRKSKQHD